MVGILYPEEKDCVKEMEPVRTLYSLGIHPISTSSLFLFHVGKAQLKPSGIAVQTPPSQESSHETQAASQTLISQVAK